MSTDWTLMSALKKNYFHLREGQLLHICKQFRFDILYLFQGRGSENETLCIYVFFFYANLLGVRVVSFQGQKMIKDGSHQGK